MRSPHPPFSLTHFANPQARRNRGYPPDLAAILNLQAHREAWTVLTALPGYAPTPLRSLPGLAASLGLGAVWIKDESERFGLGNFKALGGAYAVLRLLQRELALRLGGRTVTAQELMTAEWASLTGGITVTCATAGSHGRSVAWAARLFGCRCVVYLPQSVDAERQGNIERLGAEIVRVPAIYDDTVRRCAQDAKRNGWFVISDTAYAGYTEIPCAIMQGYTVLAEEVVRTVSTERPTHLFVQGGVGGLAAALCAHFWESWGTARPRYIVVEPEQADCLLQSTRAGTPAPSSGSLETIMGGLACREVSPPAWAVLEQGSDDFLTLPDDATRAAMMRLAEPLAADPPLVAGESGAAGLGALLAAAADSGLRAALGLDPQSRVLLIASEGAAAPDAYRRITGHAPESVRGKRAAGEPHRA
ncbi:MAG: diaminopropionate ammonia-lyase [Deltaproteobacteria bacterium]|nr:diaminopropionate ammonia-lyase [Deltaproteobacteria bacterium]